MMPTAQVSPDGSLIAFNPGSLTSRSVIFLRPLASLEAKPLPSAARSLTYFWSPDGRELALGNASDGASPTLAAVDVTSGAVRTIAELADLGAPRGGAWGRNGTILISIRGTIFRVPAAGGVPTPSSSEGGKHLVARVSAVAARRPASPSPPRCARPENVPVIQVADLATPPPRVSS
jgi:hypothetical protein